MSHISNNRLSGLAGSVKGAALSPENRRLVSTLAGVLAVVFIFVSSNVAANHEPNPHDLPVGVVGPPQLVSATARQLNSRVPGAFQILGYPSPAAARTAILHRSVYGAFDPGPPPSLLTADAASLPVATLLQETFTAAARAHGEPIRLQLRPLVRAAATRSVTRASSRELLWPPGVVRPGTWWSWRAWAWFTGGSPGPGLRRPGRCAG